MPTYGLRMQSKCIFHSDKHFEFRRIRDIRVRDIEIRLYHISPIKSTPFLQDQYSKLFLRKLHKNKLESVLSRRHFFKFRYKDLGKKNCKELPRINDIF